MAERRRAPGGIEVAIPGRKKPLRIKCVVFDFNGTMAADGKLPRGLGARVKRLAKLVGVVVMTADTFGTARRSLDGWPVTVSIVSRGIEKRRFVESVGRKRVAVVGNGVNDVPMFKAAALGIAVCGVEGTAAELLRVATILVRDINDAVDLLLKPKRLVASLRL
jgi:P-type E1-E2 ATPase